MISAIRNDKPYNEVKRGAEASLVTAMGRMSAHTGQIVTRDIILKDGIDMSPGADKLTDLSSTPPVVPDKNGKYPIPEPGRKRLKEY